MSYFNQIATRPQDTGAIDAFGRQRTSSLITLFDGKLLHDSAPLLWDDQETGGSGTTSTYNTGQASQTMAVSATTAGIRLRQTFRRFGYQSGKSHYIMCTANLRGVVAGVTKEVGYFDKDDGLFFRLTGSGASVVKRNKAPGPVTETVIPQASWNVDPMDGTGPSGFTVDWTKIQIFIIDFEWLGSGRVRMGLVLDGVIYFIHQFYHANIEEIVYLSTPNLPLSYQIENDGSGAAATMDCICNMVAAEEGRDPVGTVHGAVSDKTLGTLSDTSSYAILNLRLRDGYEDAVVQLINLGAVSDSQESKVFNVFGIVDGTIANPTTWTAVPNSHVEVMRGDVNTTITGGRIAYASTATGRDSFVSANQDAATLFAANIAGDSSIISVVIEPISNNISVYGFINWRDMP